MRLLIIIVTLFSAIVFNACKSKKAAKSNTPKTESTTQSTDPSISPGMDKNSNTQPRNFLAEGYTKGWIRDKTGLDGCKFLIQLTDSSYLQPTALDDKFMENNKKVWFKYNIKKGAMSTCMSGKVVDITDIVDRWYE